MENLMAWGTKNVLVLLAVIAAFCFLALWVTGGNFSSMVSEVIQTMMG